MPVNNFIRKELLSAVPSLRAFAVSLCGNIDRADDLVQETLSRALANIDFIQHGTNMPIWLFTILRNHFRSEGHKSRRERSHGAGHYAERLKLQPDQIGKVEFREFCGLLAQLSTDQREALVLVDAANFSYEEAAHICGCAVGTIKSRAWRARTRLSNMMGIESGNEFGTDLVTRAALPADERVS